MMAEFLITDSPLHQSIFSFFIFLSSLRKVKKKNREEKRIQRRVEKVSRRK
jgi:hypothetical protein